jgi:NAD(P)-dependent dehydrogenase (short-subunit alcohol dehydrogenase family)
MAMATPAQKVAIITGASQGIGAGLVEAYRRFGYSVVANSRTITQSDDPAVVCVAGDVADPTTGTRLVAAAVESFGRVDTLVNNAGVFVGKAFTEYTAADYDFVMGVDLRGFFNVTQPTVARMLAQGEGGHIVNVSLVLAEFADSNVPCVLESLAKGGLAAATKSLAIEYASQGIRVNALSPGTVRTPIFPAETIEAMAHLQPLGRVAEVDDIVRGVLYLESSPLVTGELLHIDGGRSAGH